MEFDRNCDGALKFGQIADLGRTTTERLRADPSGMVGPRATGELRNEKEETHEQRCLFFAVRRSEVQGGF